MSTMQSTVEELFERRDLALDQAYLAATNESITAPNALQRALFPLLSSQDIGMLVETGPAAGRLEAVFVPVMTGSRNGSQLQRLFVIASDEGLLDDYQYRLASYMRSLAVNGGQSLTLFIEDDVPLCRRYLPDGSYEDDVCNHPLDVGIDVVVATFTRFRSLFFGSGGVHAMPGSLEGGGGIVDVDFDLRRRDLFYFDEAQSYDGDQFSGFATLVEFLYAEDLDVLIGTTTLPEQLRDELSFLEELDVDLADRQPSRTLTYSEPSDSSLLDQACSKVKEHYFQSSRAGVVFSDPELARKCYEKLHGLYPQGVYFYSSELSRDSRQLVYAQIRELEKEGEGYLLVADGKSMNSADIDVNLLISDLCAPEMLVRRAGRCNRRGDLVSGELIVLGSEGYIGRKLQPSRLSSYLELLRHAEAATPFVSSLWASQVV